MTKHPNEWYTAHMNEDKNTIMDTLKEANNDIHTDTLFGNLFVYLNKEGKFVHRDADKNEVVIGETFTGSIICHTKALNEYNFKSNAPVLRTNDVPNDNALAKNMIIEGSEVLPFHEMADKYPNARKETMLALHSEQFPDNIIKVSLSGYCMNPDNKNNYYAFLRQIKKDDKRAAESVIELGVGTREYNGKMLKHITFTEAGNTSPEDMKKIAEKSVHLRKLRDSMQAKLQSERSA